MSDQWFAAILLPNATKETPMPKDWSLTNGEQWDHPQDAPVETYRCGFCGNDIASGMGLRTSSYAGIIRICPQCNGPTFFSRDKKQWPGSRMGGNVTGLTEEVEVMYGEARDCLSVGAYTASVMACRKILMNIAVAKGAEEDQQFAAYVDWLLKEGWAPKGTGGIVKYVKDRGNEANHQIVAKKREEAERVLKFIEQLLRNMFELASLVPPEPASQSEQGRNEQ